jgi:hypothetical protein
VLFPMFRMMLVISISNCLTLLILFVPPTIPTLSLKQNDLPVLHAIIRQALILESMFFTSNLLGLLILVSVYNNILTLSALSIPVINHILVPAITVAPKALFLILLLGSIQN